MTSHLIFDMLAALGASAMTFAVYVWRLRSLSEQRMRRAGAGYVVMALGGAFLGAYGLGTLNLWLSDVPLVGRSILGSLIGAICGVEIYKHLRGITGSTGIMFVAGFTTTIIIGRFGCFFEGLPDHTYGTPSTLPWAVDFGDGILRHPVQLYESTAMAAFLALALLLLARRSRFFLANGFYLMCATYAVQRFAWEFLKPYETVIGPFNVFHLACVALLIYALTMLRRSDV